MGAAVNVDHFASDYAQRVLRELEEASEALSDLHGRKRGNLRIGTLHTVHCCITSEIVSRYTAAHPDIRVSYEELTAIEVEDATKALAQIAEDALAERVRKASP